MAPKTEQLQIRVTLDQKDALRLQARAAGMDLSAFVLHRALPPANARFAELLRALATDDNRRFAFAELSDFLDRCAPMDFPDAVRVGEVAALPAWVGNYVAAMIEFAAERKRIQPPAWVRDVEPLSEPYFGTSLRSVRLHLIREAPVVFKRRNIFIDASVGARV